MKNFINKIIYVLIGLYLATPNLVYAKTSSQSELKVVMAKFMTVMIAVMVASFLLFIIGLLLKRFLAPNYIKNEENNNNSLYAPRDKDEAIVGFIMKNRLK